MTLGKQLWLLISLLLISAFLGSFVFSSLSIRSYVEEQLILKNTDTANALALTISHTEKDPALIKTFMATQFDLGHFRHISLTPLDGDAIVFEADANPFQQPVPDWFRAMLPLSSPVAAARVMDGWGEFGILRVASDTDSTYQLLWNNIQRTLLWLLALLLVVTVAARFLVRTITGPLEGVVKQAESIGRQQFVEAKEPNTDELRRVVRAMNQLSQRVKNLLATERKSVETLRKSLQFDEVTGLANRKVFMQSLEQLLDEAPAEQEHGLLMFRVLNLIELNQRLGRKKTDQLLAAVAGVLAGHEAPSGAPHKVVAARLNGSDFALLIHGRPDYEVLIPHLNNAFDALAHQLPEGTPRLPLIMAADILKGDDQRETVMTHVDGLLAQSEMNWPEQNWVVSESRLTDYALSVDQWRTLLTEALHSDNLVLGTVRISDTADNTLLEELTLTIHTPERAIPAAHFRPWVRRFGLEEVFDQRLFSQALQQLAAKPEQQLSIRLSRNAISSISFLASITDSLKRYPSQCQRLTLAIRESAAITEPAQFASFTRMVSELGARVGLVDASAEFLSSDMMPSLGLSFIHLDPNLTMNMTNDGKEELFLQRICSVAHAVGMKVIIDAPEAQQKQQALQCGVDGFRDLTLSH
ncbi:MAG: EAL domain-containing protein [Halomonadaceae bacterium]|nr:MAG: EAL domain-containing protein [Halomonadaceae bacterium]